MALAAVKGTCVVRGWGADGISLGKRRESVSNEAETEGINSITGHRTEMKKIDP